MNADVKSPTLSYAELKKLARHADPAVRVALAERGDIAPEILYFLARDDDPNVRRAVARNPDAPVQSTLLLAKDENVEVRSDLVPRIATLAPGLSHTEQSKVGQSAHAALELLAKDQIDVVRQVLSEALKDIPDAPADIIMTLARDLEIKVSGPVLAHSPVLTEENLIEIIENAPIDGALNAIATRNELGERTADAIVRTDDISAITDLLDNSSAQIREETLDNLIDKAAGVELWHKPLVARTTLHDGAAERMARYLADNLMSELQQREDLDANTLGRVKSIMNERFGDTMQEQPSPKLRPQSARDFLETDPPMDKAKSLFNTHKLNVKMIDKALRASDYRFVFAALLIRAGIDKNIGRRIFHDRSPKAILALCWKADIPISLAVQVQQRLGGLTPEQVLMPSKTNGYPLPEDEMKWQLEFFADLTARTANA